MTSAFHHQPYGLVLDEHPPAPYRAGRRARRDLRDRPMSLPVATLAPVLELLAELTADRLPGETPAQRRARRDAAADIATDRATDIATDRATEMNAEVDRMVRLLAGDITPGMDIHLDGRWLRVTEVRRDGDVVDLTAGRLRAALQSSHIVAARELADRR